LFIDGDLDNTISTHEYTHGISNRLTGGAKTVSCLNNGEQMGEGWSDYFALMMTTNWVTAKKADSSRPRAIGNYAAGLDSTYGGIRNYPYCKNFSVDPWTYDSLLSASVQTGDFFTIGEIWCSALWDLTWDLIKAEGINKTFFKSTVAGGNTTAMQLIMQGMKLQKCSPGFMDARNAILQADTLLYGGSHSGIIWKVFARRGMGYSASQGSNQLIKDGHGAYDLPPGILAKPQSDAVAEKQLIQSKQVVIVSPNPAKDNLNINIPGNTKKVSVQLVSSSGVSMSNYVLNNDNLKIDVSKLSSGVYNLIIAGENYISKFRVVIQK
jgi:hypothetical protein